MYRNHKTAYKIPAICGVWILSFLISMTVGPARTGSQQPAIVCDQLDLAINRTEEFPWATTQKDKPGFLTKSLNIFECNFQTETYC